MTEVERWAVFWERPDFARPPDAGEIRRTIVDARGAIVGALSGRRDGRRFVVHGIRAAAGTAPALASITAALAPDVEVTLWSGMLDPSLLAALRAAGFRRHVDIVRVQRALVDLPDGGDRVTFRRAPELLPAIAAAALTGSRNRHAPDTADALLADCAEHGVLNRWAVAFVGDEPAGVVLPVARGRRGSMGFVGVVPAFRGRGVGRDLLAHGLTALAAAGCDRYADGTDVQNEPMWRAFAATGCRTTGIEHTLVKEDSHG